MFLVRPSFRIFLLVTFIVNNCGVYGGGYGSSSGGSSSSFASSSASSDGFQHTITSTHQSGTGLGNAGAGASVFGGQPGITDSHDGTNGRPYEGGERGADRGSGSGGYSSSGTGGIGFGTGVPIGNVPSNIGSAGNSDGSYSSSRPAIGKPPGSYGSNRPVPSSNVGGSVPSVEGTITGPTRSGTHISTNDGAGGHGSFSPSNPGISGGGGDGHTSSGGSVYSSSGNIPAYGYGGTGAYGSGFAGSYGSSGSGSFAQTGSGGFPVGSFSGTPEAANEFQKIIDQFMKNLQNLHEAQINHHLNNPGFQGFNDIVHGSGGPNPAGYAGGYGGNTGLGFSSSGSSAGSYGGNTFGGAWAGPGGVGTFNSQPGNNGGVRPNGFTGHGGVQPGGYNGYSGVQPGGYSGQTGGGSDHFGSNPSNVGAFSSASLGPQGGYGSAHLYPSQEGLDLRFGQPITPDNGGSKSVFSSSSSGSTTVDGKTTSFKKATFTVNDNGNVTTYSISDP